MSHTHIYLPEFLYLLLFLVRYLRDSIVVISNLICNNADVDHNKLWKILKEMGIPDHLTCLLRNLYAGQEATVTTGHGATDCFQIGKGVSQGCILSPCLFNFYAEYTMENARLDEAQTNQGCREKYR